MENGDVKDHLDRKIILR